MIVPSARASKKNKLIPGDYVKINSNDAVYYGTNSIIPSDIIENTWVISMVSGSKVVLDKSADGNQSIIAAVDKKYLTKVSK